MRSRFNSLRSQGRARTESNPVFHLWIARLLLGVSLLGLAFGPRLASAHGLLELSFPPPLSILDKSLEQMQFWFNEPVSKYTIEVLDANEQRVDLADAAPLNGSSSAFVVSLKPGLAEGRYTARWEVVTPSDGHTTSGFVPFIIGEPATLPGNVALVTEASTGGVLGVVARWLVAMAAVVVTGSLAFVPLMLAPSLRLLEHIARSPGNPETETSDPTTLSSDTIMPVIVSALRRLLDTVGAALILLAVGSVFLLLVETDTGGWAITEWLTKTRRGTLWLIRSGLTVAIAVGVAIQMNSVRAQGWTIVGRWWSWALLTALSAGILAVHGLGSHSYALVTPVVVATASDFLHLVAAALWVGGLVQIMLSLLPALAPLGGPPRTRLLAALVPRFSVLAGSSVAIIAITGIYQAIGLQEVRDLGELTQAVRALPERAWGQALLIKTGLFILVLPLAAFNLLVVRPRLVQLATRLDVAGRQVAARLRLHFRRAVLGEVALVTLILVAVGVLVGNTPTTTAKEGFLPEGWFRPIILEAQAEGVSGRLVLSAIDGTNLIRYDLLLTGANGESVPRDTEVLLRMRSLAPDTGTIEEPLFKSGGGRFWNLLESLGSDGSWEITALVRRPQHEDVQLTYRQ